jgi:hypothetical protein
MEDAVQMSPRELRQEEPLGVNHVTVKNSFILLSLTEQDGEVTANEKRGEPRKRLTPVVACFLQACMAPWRGAEHVSFLASA